MAQKLKAGDHLTWNSEAGHISGRIIKAHTKDFDYKGILTAPTGMIAI